jgi:hypothetical protein
MQLDKKNGGTDHHMQGASHHRGGENAGQFRPRCPSFEEASVVFSASAPFLEPTAPFILHTTAISCILSALCRDPADYRLIDSARQSCISIRRVAWASVCHPFSASTSSALISIRMLQWANNYLANHHARHKSLFPASSRDRSWVFALANGQVHRCFFSIDLATLML